MDGENVIETAARALEVLMAGNERYCRGESRHYRYLPEHRAAMVKGQKPIAAIVACVDSRVVPEVIFDLPMGSAFVSRVPANVASDSAKWMIDLAVGEFEVPLLMVMGHTGCLAVRMIVDGKSGSGGPLRFKVQSAVAKARLSNPQDLYAEAIRRNAQETIEDLKLESSILREAISRGETSAVATVFDMNSGRVNLVG